MLIKRWKRNSFVFTNATIVCLETFDPPCLCDSTCGYAFLI